MNVLDQAHGDGFAIYQGDCVEVVRGIPSDSLHFTVYSPPFASLYTYSASDRDLGNSKTHDEFYQHFGFLLPEIFRATMPGRNMSVHCMDLPKSKVRDGVIGLSDFPGDIIRMAQDAGWIWHSKVTIWRDPVVAMQRTKALGLLHKQLLKDSCMSRMGIPDYVLTFRKPGDNPERVGHLREDFPVTLWQKWASPIWDDIDPSDTLQYMRAREDKDERHLCPLQLEVIRRCVALWSNPGDIVFSPFGGIGSEGFVALREGRKAVLCELKRSYFVQAVKNLRAARSTQASLFDRLSEQHEDAASDAEAAL